jgi:hypothetical protein
MDVYDRYGDRIGTVEFVTFGDGDFDPDDTIDLTEQARERGRFEVPAARSPG